MLEALLSVGPLPAGGSGTARSRGGFRHGRGHPAPWPGAGVGSRERQPAPLPAGSAGAAGRACGPMPAAWYSHPAWLLDRLRADWPDRLAGDRRRQSAASAALAAGQPEPHQRDRVRGPARGRTRARRPARWPGFRTPCGSTAPVPVQRLPGFAAGLVTVQDAASQLAAHLLAPATRACACSTPAPRPGARPPTCSSAPAAHSISPPSTCRPSASP